ncbi:MAG: NADPH-dependent glutamate synthase [Clostridiaceae bacterium]|nr:NADPH-dependent glutamate synthase [Clostridiaceae bacterium]
MEVQHRKPNMSLTKVPMPHQDPIERASNFNEVALGYTAEMAMEEARRCLQCKHRPCVNGCPVHVKIPEFIHLVAEGEFAAAYEKILETNCLPAVCGRVCPQENQCEEVCARGIKGEPVGIGRLERFVADWYMENVRKSIKKLPSNGHKVAIIGGGPAGLTCAGDLAALGYEVTIFEAFQKAGGVLVYGIPEFRLPKVIVAAEVDSLIQRGVRIETNMVIGRVLSVDELITDYNFEAIFLGTGAGLPVFLKIPGIGLPGVYSANEYLTRANLMKAYDQRYDTPIRISRSVAVIGGGNVAMDAARTALRLGAEKVYIVYRRSEADMPARLEEVHHAKEEGIEILDYTDIDAIEGADGGEVSSIQVHKMRPGEPDKSGRPRPIPVPDSQFSLEVDTVILAIGTSPNPLIRHTTEGLDFDKWGCLIADETSGATSRKGVFAGGDAVTGAATVIEAMGAGKKAAAAIHEFIASGQRAEVPEK